MLRLAQRLSFALAATLQALLIADATAGQSRLPVVDLALVLAVDASGSISDDRWELERQGYADAFRDPEVIRAIRSGEVGAIAVTLVQWSGRFQQSQVIGWTLVHDEASAAKFAAALAAMPHLFRSWTSISAGIAFSAHLLRSAPYETARRVIDVSGDGPDSTSEVIIQGTAADAAELRAVRDQLVAQGLVINGLPILGDPRIRSIDLYYAANVIGGEGAFEVVAEDFMAFARAVRRKLILEIAGTPSPQPLVRVRGDGP
jgi:hypothetical protein